MVFKNNAEFLLMLSGFPRQSCIMVHYRFDIRLMQTGRMKGQAFIGLPDEGVAKRALQDTNGYILHNKPMVVVSRLLYYTDFRPAIITHKSNSRHNYVISYEAQVW